MTKNAGWRSRGYLPHLDAAELHQHIVFSLADAVPISTDAPPDNNVDYLDWSERILDAGHGEALLSNPECATIVENALLHDDEIAYRLLAWCIMPTHTHVLIQQIEGHRLSDIVQTWKSVSAHMINKNLGRTGPVWRREYFDRYMRDDTQLAAAHGYIENNPVAARLIDAPELWRFSSAWWRGHAGEGAGGP